MMAKDKSPAFQWYPKDFETDEVAACMTLAERGAYITLLGYCWIEGSIPNDERRLARLCRCSESEFRKAWETVSHKFSVNDSGRLINHRLEEERISQREHAERRKGASVVGNRKRWGSQSDPNRIPIGEQKASQSDPNGNPDAIPFDRSSSSSSSSKEETKNVSSSADVIFAQILKRHPKKAAPNYAQAEFLQILSESHDSERVAVQIDESHVRWCRYWADIGTQPQFLPKLMDWLKGGDWQVDPPTIPGAETQYPKGLM